uniref:Calcineurin-like phosphoesterase domain-containing protein n=1 Tax=Chromera velia CCMP2878 TaxID=1169474 RepID=A0A0G4HUW2_9ALVE|eukprot:Cvel_8746.t1-p1 / transcript=Cvel_8746.t1 / gene=Cvel_8746 / organism=Chromera_velia_CCMP2878 / gene_product=hypothetical protein / transcript_product=hypothetical protein / location=Cvel_scaffold489:32844-35467(+) / protein_length=540 / sequence_SO=supercontig / SO=protein_coding / is_pseudo=false
MFGLPLFLLLGNFLPGSSLRLGEPPEMVKRALQVVGQAVGRKKKPATPERTAPGGCRDLEVLVKGDTLRILHMSDFHFHPTKGCNGGDVPEQALLREEEGGCSKATEEFVNKVTDEYLPEVDLVVLNGDLINWDAVRGDETDLSKFLLEKPGFLRHFVDQANVQNVPVMVLLGNHDSPSMTCVDFNAENGKGPSVFDCDVSSFTVTFEQRIRKRRWGSVQGMFSRSANLCTAPGDEVHGVGNLVVFANVNGKKVPLVFVDSGTALSLNVQPFKEAEVKEVLYDWVRPSQVDWMKNRLANGHGESFRGTVPGFIFTHHPPALTTRPVKTFHDSFALDNVKILSGQMWVGSRNHGKPDQGEKGGEFRTVENFSCATSSESKRPLRPVISSSEYSTNPKENWKLNVREDKEGAEEEACAGAEEMEFFDGPSQDRGETLMQAATSSRLIAALFSGHHHENDYCAIAEDTPVAFCYGGTAGYTAATYEKAKEFGPRPRGAKLEHQVRLIHYQLPKHGKARLSTRLIRDIYGGGTELGPETVLPLA